MTNFKKLQDLLPAMEHQRAPISGNLYGCIFFYWGLKGKVAFDTDTEAVLWRSRGRRKAGSEGTRYSVHAPNGKLKQYNMNGTGKEYEHIFGFMAVSDDDAINKANKMFTNKFEKMRKSDKERTHLEQQ